MQDFRVRRSRRALKQALLVLMKTKNYSRITIKELCETAGLNRSTFYDNYGDIHALLLDIHTDIFDGMLQALNENPSVSSEDPLKNRIRSVTQIIIYLQENMDIFQLLLTNNDDNLFEKHLSAYYMEKYCSKDAGWKECYLFLYHAIGSFTLIHQWIRDKCPCTPQELAEMICVQSENAG